jgi:hypothetical protein
MDDIVVRGMAKWPDVPAVYGWLSLDRRGTWLIKGDRIGNRLVTEFIGRNYGHDERGRWYFQNGPQRVFVDLHYTPLVLRIVSPAGAPLALLAHTSKPVEKLSGISIDENGAVLLDTEQGGGIIHDGDLECLLPYLVDANGNPLPEAALDAFMDLAPQGKAVPMWLKWQGSNLKVDTINSRDVPRRFGFIAHPEPASGEESCR